MLKRRVSANGVAWYESEALARLGARHAFSTRIGGVSGPPFDTLNLGNPHGAAVQDALENIRENYARLAAAAGLEGRQLRRVHQVHGAEVLRVEHEAEPRHDLCADAVVTTDPRCMVTVRVADCVPVLLAGEGARMVAAVHAGWRGVIAGVVGAAVRAMGGAAAGAIGPCIGMDAFEVGAEVAEAFRAAFGDRAPMRPGREGKWHVDLREAVRMQLVSAGVAVVDSADLCTVRDRGEFFSHRRDAGVTGRMAGVIGCAGEA